MWLWIIVGTASYLTLFLMIVGLAAAARTADRRERAIFASWLQERRTRIVPEPPLRIDQPRAA